MDSLKLLDEIVNWCIWIYLEKREKMNSQDFTFKSQPWSFSGRWESAKRKQKGSCSGTNVLRDQDKILPILPLSLPVQLKTIQLKQHTCWCLFSYHSHMWRSLRFETCPLEKASFTSPCIVSRTSCLISLLANESSLRWQFEHLWLRRRLKRHFCLLRQW
jgi:hypothetical protein